MRQAALACSLSTLISVGTLATARAAAPTELVVGQVAALSGSNAASGVPVMQGARLYFDFLNATGGINGRRIRFLSRDDGYKVNETVRLANELIQKDNVLVLLNTIGTANNEALIRERVLTASGVAMVGPRSGASSLYGVPNVYPIRASYHDETRAIVRQLATVGIARIGVVYQDDALGKDALAGLEQALKDQLLTLAADASFERNTVQVGPAVTTMLNENPQAIVLLGVTEPAAAFIKAFRGRGGTSQIFCLSIVDPGTVVNRVGPELARGLAMTVVVPGPGQVALPLIREMLRARDTTGQRDLALSLNAIEGYIGAKVVAEVLRKAGPDPSRTTIIRTLNSLTSVDVGGYVARLRATATEPRYVDLGVIGPNGNLLR